jgi:SAM-dependent methyltransferase
MSTDVAPGAPAVPEYAFDNNTAEGAHQLRLLAEILDPHTFDVLAAQSVGAGWDCWDIGTGGGTVATWLADRVGPEGHVLATDIKPHHVPGKTNVTVMRHDLRSDPFPERKFDLIHARLLLMHLPEREELVHRMRDALKPGGVLVVSDWEISRLDLVLDSPDDASSAVFRKFLDAILAFCPSAGVDPHWAARSHRVFRAAGLTDVLTVTDARSWAGGTAGCLLHRGNSVQLSPRLHDVGLTEEDLARLREVLLDPRFVASSYLMFTTTGRRYA